MTRASRLLALERAAASVKAVDEEAQARRLRDEESAALWQAKWAIMCSTMSEEHVAMVVEAYTAGQQYVTSEGYRTPAASLLRRCLDALGRHGRPWAHSEIKPEVALAMPPVVAEVYLNDQGAIPLHDCEDCGYRVPHQYFKQCPLCGGPTGFNAFWHAHKRKPD